MSLTIIHSIRNRTMRIDQIMSRKSWELCSILTLVAGCTHSVDPKAFTPPDELAHDALTVALNAWESGTVRGAVKNGQMVELADSVQRSGRKLMKYEIVGSALPQPDDPNQHFSVKITLEGGMPEDVIYVVVGKDPIWVFRDGDYRQLGGM